MSNSGKLALARHVAIPSENALLQGELKVPIGATGLVVFAHGSGSSRFSPRNQSVAKAIREAGMGTLLFDLLTAEEEESERLTRHLRFDIGLLAGRLADVTRSVRSSPDTSTLRIGYFGASTGAAAALVAAAALPDDVAAIVSRGGRPDLAGPALQRVKAPTLLIVGGADEVVIRLNQQAYSILRCDKQLDTVLGATHLFEEQGALEKLADLAIAWFSKHLGQERTAASALRPSL